jgi:hypothetical protein
MTNQTLSEKSLTSVPGGGAKLGFLTEAYFERFAALATALPENEPVEADVQYLVREAPSGDVAYYLRIRKGRIVEAGLGSLGRPGIGIEVAYRDLVELNTGVQHPAAAFMSGVMRVTGDKALLLDLMLVMQTSAYQGLMMRLGRETAYA